MEEHWSWENILKIRRVFILLLHSKSTDCETFLISDIFSLRFFRERAYTLIVEQVQKLIKFYLSGVVKTQKVASEIRTAVYVPVYYQTEYNFQRKLVHDWLVCYVAKVCRYT